MAGSSARESESPCRGDRSPAQAQKRINSRLLYAIRQRHRQSGSEGGGLPRVSVKVDDRGRALVDISSTVSQRLLSCIEKLGGSVISSDEQYHTIRAAVPFGKIEALAEFKDVWFIRTASEAMTH